MASGVASTRRMEEEADMAAAAAAGKQGACPQKICPALFGHNADLVTHNIRII